MEERLIYIGEILKPQGNKGEVKVYPLSDDPNRYYDLESVFICCQDEHMSRDAERHAAPESLQIESVRLHKGLLSIKFYGIDSIADAERLRGKFISIPESELRELPEGHYYVFQIIGLSVYNESGKELGKVKDVIKTGSNDVYVVRGEEGKGELLIPAIKSVVKLIDIEASRIVVDLPKGL